MAADHDVLLQHDGVDDVLHTGPTEDVPVDEAAVGRDFGHHRCGPSMMLHRDIPMQIEDRHAVDFHRGRDVGNGDREIFHDVTLLGCVVGRERGAHASLPPNESGAVSRGPVTTWLPGTSWLANQTGALTFGAFTDGRFGATRAGAFTPGRFGATRAGALVVGAFGARCTGAFAAAFACFR